MAIHQNLKPSDQEIPLLLAGQALSRVDGLVSRPMGAVSVDNVDGSSTLIGGNTDTGDGDVSGGFVTQVGKTSLPGTPSGLSVSSVGLTVMLTWDGSFKNSRGGAVRVGAVLADANGTTISMGSLTGAGVLTALATAPGMASVAVTAYDYAHDESGAAAPNHSDTETLDIVLSELVDSKQITDTVEANRKTLDQANKDLAHAKTDIAAAASTAQYAKTQVEANKKTLDQANKDLAQAKTDIAAASNAAQSAKTTAEENKRTLDQANKDLAQAKTDIVSAASTAQAAKTTADANKKTLDQANKDLTQAKTDIAAAANTAQSAKTTADANKKTLDQANKDLAQAKNDIVAAASTAQSAKTVADDAKTSADKAVSDAASAISAASTAQKNASTALTTANTAKNTADTAKATAGKAASDAASATSAASAAQKNAATALTSANTALQRAKNITVSSTAPNNPTTGDIWYPQDNSGRVIGMKTWGGTGWVDVTIMAGSIIVPGSIGSTLIGDGQITTGKLAAGSVTAESMSADAVTARSLAVGDYTNLLDDSLLEKTSTDNQLASRWEGHNLSWTRGANVPSGTGNVLVVRKIKDEKYFNPWVRNTQPIPCKGGDTFYAGAYLWYWNDVKTTMNVQLKVRDLDNQRTYYLSAGRGTADIGQWQWVDGATTIPASAGRCIAQVFIFAGGYLNQWTDKEGTLQLGYHMVYSPVLRHGVGGTQIADGSISTSKIIAGSITGDKLAANSVNADNIVANAVTTEKIATSAVNADKLAANSVNADKLVANAVTTDKLAANSVNADKLVTNSVTTEKIAAGAVNADKLAANSVSASKIIAGSITGDKLAANSVNADKLVANSVTAEKIAASAVDADKIAAGSVTADKIAANAVTTDKLAANSVNADKLVANAVTTEKIAAGAVDADKLAANSVSASKIVAGSITGDKLAANTVNADNLAANAVTADKLAANSVTTEKIGANSVTADKIAANAVTAGKIAANSITADKLAANSITADKLKGRKLVGAEIYTDDPDKDNNGYSTYMHMQSVNNQNLGYAGYLSFDMSNPETNHGSPSIGALSYAIRNDVPVPMGRLGEWERDVTTWYAQAALSVGQSGMGVKVNEMFNPRGNTVGRSEDQTNFPNCAYVEIQAPTVQFTASYMPYHSNSSYASGYLSAHRTLFHNDNQPSAGVITLNDDITHYWKLEFEFKTNDGVYFGMPVYRPSVGKKFNASTLWYGMNDLPWLKTRAFVFTSSRTLDCVSENNGTYWHTGQQPMGRDWKANQGDYISVTHVEGFFN